MEADVKKNGQKKKKDITKIKLSADNKKSMTNKQFFSV